MSVVGVGTRVVVVFRHRLEQEAAHMVLVGEEQVGGDRFYVFYEFAVCPFVAVEHKELF